MFRYSTYVSPFFAGAATIVLAACSSGSTSASDPASPAATASNTAKASSPAAAIAADYVSTPFGVQLHKDCVVTIPEGAKVNRDGDLISAKDGSLVRHVPQCTHTPMIRGALVVAPDNVPTSGSAGGPNGPNENPATQFDLTQNVVESNWTSTVTDTYTNLNTQLVVPAAPTQPSGVVYFYNALEDLTNNELVATALQYGVSGAGGGNYWSVGGWYIVGTNNGYYYTAYASALTPVNAGDTLDLVISPYVASCNDDCWYRMSWNDSTNTSLSNYSWQYTNAGPFAARRAYALNIQLDNVTTGCNGVPGGSSGGQVIQDVSLLDPSGRNVTPSDWNQNVYSHPGDPSCSYSFPSNGSTGFSVNY